MLLKDHSKIPTLRLCFASSIIILHFKKYFSHFSRFSCITFDMKNFSSQDAVLRMKSYCASWAIVFHLEFCHLLSNVLMKIFNSFNFFS